MILLYITNIVIALANILLLVFMYLQFKNSIKPTLTTKLMHEGKNIEEIPNVFEYGDVSLVVSNISSYIARNLVIKYSFKLGRKKSVTKKQRISRLNPYEAVKILLGIIKIKEKYPRKVWRNRKRKNDENRI